MPMVVLKKVNNILNLVLIVTSILLSTSLEAMNTPTAIYDDAGKAAAAQLAHNQTTINKQQRMLELLLMRHEDLVKQGKDTRETHRHLRQELQKLRAQLPRIPSKPSFSPVNIPIK